MKRIMRSSLAAWAGALVLMVSLESIACAQELPESLTELETTAVQRLREMIEVMNTGDYATMRRYFEANSVADPPGASTFPGHVPTFSFALIRYSTSHGFDLVRVTTYPPRGAVVGIVRNRLTGDEEFIPVMVEPQAPHRITGLPVIPPAEVATWNLRRVASVAATEEERLQEIGEYLKRMGDADVFSGAVIIARGGQPVFAEAYGYADREKKIPNTLDTPFLLGSITKLFTGLAIGRLVEQGKLSYEDSLGKFLPDFPDGESAGKIRVKHLLSHTSGLGDYLGSKAYTDALSDTSTVTVTGLVDKLERKPPAFEPGTRWAYSNMGFVLLGRIIEIVTGRDYYDYVQENVFAVAGATSAGFPALPESGVAVVPMAYPYGPHWDPENHRMYDRNELGTLFRRGSPAGSSVASVRDLLKLYNAMNAGQIVTRETFLLHSRPKPELSAPTYGYGFIAGPYLGRPFVGHNGRSPGACTESGELRDTPYTVLVLSNRELSPSPADRVCQQVTARILRVLRPS